MTADAGGRRADAAHHVRIGTVSVEEQLERIGWGRFQAITLSAFILIIMADGMELVVTNIIWPQLPAHSWGLAAWPGARGMLVSVAFCGFVLGTFASAALGDYLGRRPLIFLHSGTFVPMSLFSAFSNSLPQLAVTRFLVGMSMGLVFPSVCSMMAEFTPSAWRARAVMSIPGFSYSLGQALVLVVGIVLIRNSEQLQLESGEGSESLDAMCKRAEHEQDFTRCAWWRGMLVVGIIPDLIAVIIVYFFVPESPRYLLYRGKSEELRETLIRIARLNNAEDRLADEGYSLPLTEQRSMGGWKTIVGRELLQPPLSHLLTLVVGIWCALSVIVMGGSFLFPIYLEQYLELSREQGYWLMVAMSLIEIPGVFCVFLVIDSPEYGRRGTMLYLTAASALAALSLTFTWRMGLMTFFVGNLAMRSLGVLPYEIMYVYAAEIMPTSHRNTGLAIGSGASKLVGGILPLLLLPLVTQPQTGAVTLSRGSSAASLLAASLPGRLLPKQIQLNLTDVMSNMTDAVAEAEPVDDEAATGHVHNVDSMPSSETWGGGNENETISVPYLILCISACIATMMLYTSPDPSDTLCDTAIETDIALETARSGSRLSSRRSTDSSMLLEAQPLVGGARSRNSADRKPVAALYRLQA